MTSSTDPGGGRLLRALAVFHLEEFVCGGFKARALSDKATFSPVMESTSLCLRPVRRFTCRNDSRSAAEVGG